MVNEEVHLLIHELEPVYLTFGSHVIVELKVSPQDRLPLASHVFAAVFV
jgi:hypothetical protein